MTQLIPTTAEVQQIWDNLSLASNFIFQKVMQNPELCKKILSEIMGVTVEKVEYPEYEKTIDIRLDSKSIRLDVYVQGDENIYNIEIQNQNTDSIPKRSRYYQGLIDLDLIQKGCYYKELKRSTELRREFMTLYLHEEEIRRECLEQGRINGLAEGRAEGLAGGILQQTIKYYKLNRISLEEALADTELSEEAFLNLVNKSNTPD